MKLLISTLTGAPWWVYIILAYVSWIGFQATKPHTIWLPKIFLAPVIFVCLSLVNILHSYGAHFIVLTLYGAALLVGSGLSWLLISLTGAVFDKDQILITLPGSYANLILFLSNFAIKFYWTYIEALYPNLTQVNFTWMILKIMSTGVVTGLTLGKNLAYLYKYFKA